MLSPARTRPWAWVLLVVTALVVMWPVWTSPVHADDRYWYLNATGDSEGSPAAVLARIVPDADPANGRVTPLAFAVRRLTSMALLELSRATGVPLGIYHGVLLLSTFLVAVATAVWLVRSLRRRSPDGLVQLSPATRRFLVAGLVAAVAAGAQTQAPFRNAWVAYPVLTVGAVTVVLGSMALLLVTARLVARRPVLGTVVAVVGGVLLAVLLNTTYELYYVAVPATVLLVAVLPATADGALRAELRAKAVALAPFLLAFTGLFVWIRGAIAAECAARAAGDEGRTCYAGTQPQVGVDLVVTTVRNLVGSVPGLGRSELLQDLERVGRSELPPLVTVASVLLALLLAASVWLVARPGEDERATGATAGSGAGLWSVEGEPGVLLRAGLVVGVTAVGSAAVMALSVQAQEVIDGFGRPYRHTVLTWVCAALAVLLVVRALWVRRPAAGPALLGATAVAVAVLVAVGHPVNVAATRAALEDPGTVAVARFHAEVLREDPSAEGDSRRCEALAQLEEDVRVAEVRARMLRGADDVYRLWVGVPFCSTAEVG